MANYVVSDTELQSVANAIRTKGGTSGQLVFPAGFVNAVNAIPSGANISKSSLVDFDSSMIYFAISKLTKGFVLVCDFYGEDGVSDAFGSWDIVNHQINYTPTDGYEFLFMLYVKMPN